MSVNEEKYTPEQKVAMENALKNRRRNILVLLFILVLPLACCVGLAVSPLGASWFKAATSWIGNGVQVNRNDAPAATPTKQPIRTQAPTFTVAPTSTPLPTKVATEVVEPTNVITDIVAAGPVGNISGMIYNENGQVEPIEYGPDGPVVPDDYKIAGADFFAIAVESLENGWMRLREATNSNPPYHPEYASWAFQFQLAKSDTVFVQFDKAINLNMVGTGDVTFKVVPDEIGYSTSDILGTGLAWWPAGNNGQYRVSFDKGQTWSEWTELSTGPEGIDFPNDGTEVWIQFELSDGFVNMPLGEIRNNVLPYFHK